MHSLKNSHKKNVSSKRPSAPASLAKTRTVRRKYLSDPLTQIKPYKGRNKFELYIHNQVFREQVDKLPLQIPNENLTEFKVLQKKLIFQSLSYGQVIQTLCQIFAKALKSPTSTEALQQNIQTLFLELRDEFKIEQFPVDSQEFHQALEKAYQRAQLMLKDFL